MRTTIVRSRWNKISKRSLISRVSRDVCAAGLYTDDDGGDEYMMMVMTVIITSITDTTLSIDNDMERVQSTS